QRDGFAHRSVAEIQRAPRLGAALAPSSRDDEDVGLGASRGPGSERCVAETARRAPAEDDRLGVRPFSGGQDLRRRVRDRLEELRLDTAMSEKGLCLAENAVLLIPVGLAKGLKSGAHGLGSRDDVDDRYVPSLPGELRTMLGRALRRGRCVVGQQKHVYGK